MSAINIASALTIIVTQTNRRYSLECGLLPHVEPEHYKTNCIFHSSLARSEMTPSSSKRACDNVIVDGSLATKQVVFLQRPVLSRKRRESKKLIFKSKKKKKKNKQSAAEKDLEVSKILDDGGKVVKEESRNVNENKGNKEEKVKETEVETVCKEGEAPCEVEEVKEVEAETEDRVESGVETGEERDGAAGTDDKSDKEGRVEEGEEAGTETEQEREGEREIVEERENGVAVEDETETTKGSEVEAETKEQSQKGGGAEMEVKENGVETEEETNGGEENGETENVAMQQDPPDQEEYIVQEEVQKAVKDDGQVKLTNQCPEESQGSD
ncbi:unnamed protein product, partial [Coregonus sp. 'balchen']